MALKSGTLRVGLVVAVVAIAVVYGYVSMTAREPQPNTTVNGGATTTTTTTTTTALIQKPASPQALSASLEDPYMPEIGAVNLSWDGVTEAKTYRVYSAPGLDGDYQPIRETIQPYCAISDVAYSPTYYRVTAVNDAGESEPSISVKIRCGSIRDGLIPGPSVKTSSFGDEVFRSLVVAPSDPDVVYVGSEGCGLFRSIDGGVSWEWQRNGLLYMAGVPAEYGETYDMAVDPTDPDRAYAALTAMFSIPPGGPTDDTTPCHHGGVYVTSDGGATWVRSVEGLLNGAAASIVVDPKNHSTLYLAVSGGPDKSLPKGANKPMEGGGIYRSTDGGASWTRLTLPDPEVAAWSDFWKIIIRGDSTLFTLGQQDENPSPTTALGLIRSDDGGETWRKVNPEGVLLTSFDAAPLDHEIVYGVSYYGVYDEAKRTQSSIFRSTDGGETWLPVGDYQFYGPVRVSPHDSATVFVSHRHALYKSTDGLATVTKVLETTEYITDIEFSESDPDIMYAGASGLLVYKSVDGGDSFTLAGNLREYIESHK